jgi:drug/metabolite transporter (DMT)-like permease
MKTKYYIANAITGALLGFLGYLIFIFSEMRGYHAVWATIASIIGFSIGISSIIFIRKTRPDIFLGLCVGLGASYIVFLLLSAIFGHPESHTWTGGLSYGFMLIALVITSFSVISFARSSFTHGTRFVERRSKT